jgi:hypothetical protein
MVHIRRRDVADPLVVALVVLEADEVRHRRPEDLGARVDQQIESRLERLVEALERAVGLGMVGRAVDVPDPQGTQVVLEGRPSGSRSPGP